MCRCRYLSALLLSLSTMLNLELPQVNVLSKVDLVPHYGQLGEEGLPEYLCVSSRHYPGLERGKPAGCSPNLA